jgi:hypothetical protein
LAYEVGASVTALSPPGARYENGGAGTFRAIQKSATTTNSAQILRAVVKMRGADAVEPNEAAASQSASGSSAATNKFIEAACASRPWRR